MTIKIEKETRWNGYDQKSNTEYYVWVDGRIAAITKTEKEAHNIVEKIKSTYVKPSTEVIYEEEI
jgi:hypothetical protein